MTDIFIHEGRRYLRTSTIVNSNNYEKVYEAINILNPTEILYWHIINPKIITSSTLDRLYTSRRLIGGWQNKYYLNGVIGKGLIRSWENTYLPDASAEPIWSINCITRELDLLIEKYFKST